MGGKKIIRAMMNAKNITYEDLKLIFKYKSVQSARNKMTRNTFTYREIEQLADELGYRIVFEDKETGQRLEY